MSEPWDGCPQNPEREGWHWLTRAEDGLTIPKRWNAEMGAWEDGIMLSPATVIEWGANYAGPCHAPAEVTAQVKAARQEEREACAQVVLRGKTVLLAGIGPVDGYPWDNASAAAAIRARGDA